MSKEYKQWKQVLIAFDQLWNTFIPGGWADETISSRCYRWHRDGVVSWPRNAVNALFFWEKNHCESAYYGEIKRVQLPPEMRKTNNGS